MHSIALDNQHVPLPTTSLVGRSDDLDRLTALLTRPDVRLVTLLGPGGVGKTRLALQIAHGIDVDLVGPVRMVFLANTADPADTLPAIGRVLGLNGLSDMPIEAQITENIGDDPLLLILDNVEQIADHLAILADLIGRCPRLTILVTSRVMLRLSVEHIFAVDPLPTNSAGYDVLAPATALFVDRARLVQPDLELTEENIRAIDSICQKVDGLPLAIELAAARTRFLSPVALRDRITERLSMLVGGPRDAPERHRTLRATLSWSHDLLDPEERILFRRLAVAVNGIPYDAVGPICNSTGDLGDHVEDVLDALVDHSLVRIENVPETGPRVRLLHTVREFAEEQLERSGEKSAVHRAHALWFARLVIDTPGTTWGTGRPELRTWTLRHLPDRSTFSTVLKRLMAWDEHERALKMTAQLVGFWNELGQIRDAIEWCDRLLPYVEDAPAETRADFYFKAALTAHMANKDDDALDYATRSLALSEELGDLRSIANLHNLLGNLQWQRGNLQEGEHHQREAIAATEAEHNPVGTAMFRTQLADRLAEHGKYDEAEQLLDEAEPIIAQGRPDAMPLLLGSRAILHLMTDRIPEAARNLARSLVHFVEPPHRRPDMLSQLLICTADLAARAQCAEDGVILLGASRRIVDDIGLIVNKGFTEEVDRITSSLASQVTDGYDDLVRKGRLLSIPAMIDVALSVCEHASTTAIATTPPVRMPAERSDDDLTPREHDVLRLLVEGKSNAAIADELFISQRTVTTHLTRLYAKLDVTSRTAAIAAALRMGIAGPS